MALRRSRYGSTGHTYDWGGLPCELIASILKHLDDRHVDRRWAASTCVSWHRASALVNSKKPPCNKLPFICTCRAFNINPCLCPGLKYYSVLRQSSYYFIVSPTSSRIQTRPWLIRAEEVGTNKWLLHHPISWKDDYQATPSGLEYNFYLVSEYKILDVAKLHTLHHVFDIEKDPYKGSSCFQWTMPFVRKVVPLSDLGMLLVLFDVTGKLALWTEDGRRQWSFIDTSYYEIDDIVYLRGQFYAVDKIGRLVTINPTTSFDLREIASPPPGGKCDVKVMHLVCSDGCLYLVYKLFECTKVNWMRYPRVVRRESWMENSPLLFRNCHVIDEPKDNVGVYVFDKQAGAWVRVENLGDKVFFIANYVAFSVNARELRWSRGSFIYYMSKDFDNGPGLGEFFDVYKLDDYLSTKQDDGDLPIYMALHLASSVHDLPEMI